jgi:PBP1b-binding outer membrane lipoprotein LpoB
MVQFKSIILVTIVGLAILLSGCVGNQAGTPTPTPTVTPTATYTVTATATPTITATPVEMVTTPTPTATAPMLSGALYVDVRMMTPSNWGNGTYELRSVQATITDVINMPISLKAQIVSDGQILEEQSFTLQSGSSYNFANGRTHIINSTNVSLWLFAEGYQPTEYKITKIYR